jgi:hypothetical protein
LKQLLTILLTWILLLPVARANADYSGCFIPGESSELRVRWMGVPIAWSKTVVDEVEEGGESLIRIRVRSANYKAYHMVYRVDDFAEVVLDPKTALPRRLEVHIREGSRESYHKTRFDHQKGVAVTRDMLTGKEETIPIQPDTRDLYTLIYAIRNLSIDELVNTPRTVFVEGKMYNLTLKRHRTKKIHLPVYGDVSSVEIEPFAEFDGFFIRKGKIMFWVSERKPRMITCIKAKVPVGTVTVKLQQVTFPMPTEWDRD